MKLALTILGIIAGLILIVLGINFYLSPQDELSKADVIIAISGGDTKSRTLKAVELYKQGYAPKLLFSGAALDPLSPSNAKAMHDLAIENGVPEADILIEEQAQNTSQNASKTQGILEPESYETVILVTSPYHQRRASLEFQDKLGDNVKVINYSSQDSDWPKHWFVTPKGWWLGLSETVKTVVTAVKNLN